MVGLKASDRIRQWIDTLLAKQSFTIKGDVNNSTPPGSMEV